MLGSYLAFVMENQTEHSFIIAMYVGGETLLEPSRLGMPPGLTGA